MKYILFIVIQTTTVYVELSNRRTIDTNLICLLKYTHIQKQPKLNLKCHSSLIPILDAFALTNQTEVRVYIKM